jgi:hypothetical protein
MSNVVESLKTSFDLANAVAIKLNIKINEDKSLIVDNTNKVIRLKEELELIDVNIPVSDSQTLVGITFKLDSNINLDYKKHFQNRFMKLKNVCNKV